MIKPEPIQTYIVEYEIGNETKYTRVVCDTYASAQSAFKKLNIKDALNPIFIPMGKVIDHTEFKEHLKKHYI